MPSDSAARADLTFHVIHHLQQHGHRAYLVGGCVRDRLLGIAPKDYDVSTDATPGQLLSLFPNSETVGAHFGVVLVKGSAGASVEVATFRSEGAYADGRRPDTVRFETDPAMDARRRDFTVNGLMQDADSGQVLDFVGGLDDLEHHTIRAIGDPRLRFAEDHLRMLRAVRFAARLGFSIDSNTIAAIRELAPQISRISAERIRDELIRILTEGSARRGLELLDETGLLDIVLPEVKAFQGVPQPPEYHPEGDVWTHVLLMLEKLHSPSPALAAGVLLHDVGKPPTIRIADRIRFEGHAEVGAEIAARILHRLRFANAEAEHITSLVANHMKFKDVMQMRPSTLKRFLRLPRFDEHLELHRLDCEASNGYTEAYRFVQSKLAEYAEEELRPPRLVTGDDLIAEGYKPGPAFARALSALETAQLDGQISTRSDALVFVRKVLNPEA